MAEVKMNRFIKANPKKKAYVFFNWIKRRNERLHNFLQGTVVAIVNDDYLTASIAGFDDNMTFPVNYLDCNARAFEVGDKCTIYFPQCDYTNGTVIGFARQNPKPCATWHNITPSSSSHMTKAGNVVLNPVLNTARFNAYSSYDGKSWVSSGGSQIRLTGRTVEYNPTPPHVYECAQYSERRQIVFDTSFIDAGGYTVTEAYLRVPHKMDIFLWNLTTPVYIDLYDSAFASILSTFAASTSYTVTEIPINLSHINDTGYSSFWYVMQKWNQNIIPTVPYYNDLRVQIDASLYLKY